jgi:hypothetical protein
MPATHKDTHAIGKLYVTKTESYLLGVFGVLSSGLCVDASSGHTYWCTRLGFCSPSALTQGWSYKCGLPRVYEGRVSRHDSTQRQHHDQPTMHDLKLATHDRCWHPVHAEVANPPSTSSGLSIGTPVGIWPLLNPQLTLITTTTICPDVIAVKESADAAEWPCAGCAERWLFSRCTQVLIQGVAFHRCDDPLEFYAQLLILCGVHLKKCVFFQCELIIFWWQGTTRCLHMRLRFFFHQIWSAYSRNVNDVKWIHENWHQIWIYFCLSMGFVINSVILIMDTTIQT